MADSSNIDAALLAVLAADATLAGLMPDGVWIDVAPPGSKQFVRISLDDERDEAVFVAGRAIEDALFLVEAVELSTVAVSHARAAAASRRSTSARSNRKAASATPWLPSWRGVRTSTP